MTQCLYTLEEQSQRLRDELREVEGGTMIAPVKIPKVYTNPLDAWSAVLRADLKPSGHVGGLFKLQTAGGEVSFLIPAKLTSTAVSCYAGAFKAGIKYAQRLAADAADRAVESVPDETPPPSELYQASTRDEVYVIKADHEELALDLLGHRLAYNGFEDMAASLGMTVEEAKLKVRFRAVTYFQACEWIIGDAYLSNVYADHLHQGSFRSSREWAIWRLSGQTGENCRTFARKNRLDLVRVWDTVEWSLSHRPLGKINDGWLRYVERRNAV